MTSFWDHLYQYAQEHLVVRYLQEEPTGYGRLSIQTDARRRGLEDLLRGPWGGGSPLTPPAPRTGTRCWRR